MQISKSLPKPQNWQDFETLCKKLWGEIWSCPEIKKNGIETFQIMYQLVAMTLDADKHIRKYASFCLVSHFLKSNITFTKKIENRF